MTASEVLLQQILNGLTVGSYLALIALGYTMVYGIIELINFAHGDVYMMGFFISLSFLGLLDATTTLSGLTLVWVIAVVMPAQAGGRWGVGDRLMFFGLGVASAVVAWRSAAGCRRRSSTPHRSRPIRRRPPGMPRRGGSPSGRRRRP